MDLVLVLCEGCSVSPCDAGEGLDDDELVGFIDSWGERRV